VTKIRNVGLIFLLSSAIIYGSALISASVYSQVLIVDGWDSRYGIFGTALREVGILPITIAILLGIVGMSLIVKSVRSS